MDKKLLSKNFLFPMFGQALSMFGTNMIGRLMALFNVCNNVALPIGIWLQGILYEKYDDKLPVVFGEIAALAVLVAVRGKNVYLRLQNDGQLR